jgi:uncharacterized protein (TIGR00661 family)
MPKNNMNHLFEESPSEKHVYSGHQKPRILVAPLDWGLGHATRCIPVIRELLNQGTEVLLAGEAAQENLLKAEFPDIPFLSLPGYRVRYARSTIGLLKNIFFQIPKILKAIKQENAWLKEMVDKHDLDAVIADNRYGLYHSSIRSIFITHQLTIKSSLGSWTEKILQKRNYRYINRFSECWVPDAFGRNNLAGNLSHPRKQPAIPVRYIGILSRFNKTNTEEKRNHLLVILSGPEPQRSILENKIVIDIAHYPGTVTVVRGVPGASSIIPSTNSIKFYNHLQSYELNREMEQAEYIISRSGYSTVMDIVRLQKKSVLIPTPGQTEQAYLSRYLQQKKIALRVAQNSFSLSSALQLAKTFSYDISSIQKENNLQKVIAEFVHSIR